MRKSLSFLIVEDRAAVAQDLKEILSGVGYSSILITRTDVEAMNILRAQEIDLVLCNMNLNQTKSGIDLANQINNNVNIPFIFITSFESESALKQAKENSHATYLLKPYSRKQLLAAIEFAIFNYSHKQLKALHPELQKAYHEDGDLIINGHLLIKENAQYIKIPLLDIWWLESNINYLEVKTAEKNYFIRSSLKKVYAQLPKNYFVKCHKKFVINTEAVNSFTNHFVTISGNQIPISAIKLTEVLRVMGLKHR